MRSVDGGQFIAARSVTIRKGASLIDSDEGSDEDGVALAGYESRRHGRPQPLFRTWGQIAGDRGYAASHEDVPLEGNALRSDLSLHSCFLYHGRPMTWT